MRIATDRHNQLRKWFSVKQVAGALGLSINTVRNLIARKELTAVCMAGHSVRIPADDIERFLRARTMGRPFHAPQPSDPDESPAKTSTVRPTPEQRPRPRRAPRRPPEPLAPAA